MQESEVNGSALKQKDQDFGGDKELCQKERHRRTDPLPLEARKKEVERLQGIIQNLRREAVTTKNKAEHEIKQRDTEIEALRRSCQLQREHIEKQKREILALEFTLRDYRITDMDQQRALSKFNSNAEAQLHRQRLHLASMQQAHEQAQERAQQLLTALRKEKAAMYMGLAAIAQQSIGGPDASAEDLAADVEAAVADNCEPIPRNASAWSQLKFHLDDVGNLAILNRGPSSHLRPFDRDGARAIAALCAQVARLFSQRGALRSRLRSLEEQKKKGVHAESLYLQVSHDLVLELQGEVHRLSKICCQTPPHELPPQSSRHPKNADSPRGQALPTVARQDALDGDNEAATASPTSAQGMAAVRQVVSHMLRLLSAAHKEELASRCGSSSPTPSKQSRSTPMASRGRAKGSPPRPKPTLAMNMYKEATDYCTAILHKELAVRHATRAASPPRTAPEQAPSYMVPIKLATKPGTVASGREGRAAIRKGLLNGQHEQQQGQQEQWQGRQEQQQHQQTKHQEQQQGQQEQQQHRQPKDQEEEQQQQQQQGKQEQLQHHCPKQRDQQQGQQQQYQHPKQEEQQQEQPEQRQHQHAQQQERLQGQQKQQQQQHPKQEEQQQEQHDLGQHQQAQQQEQQKQHQHEQLQQQEQQQEQEGRQQHQQAQQREQHQLQPSHDVVEEEMFPSPSSLSSSSSSSSSDDETSSSGSSMQAGDDEFEEVVGED